MMMSEPDALIHLVNPRETIEIHLPDGRVLAGPRGTTLEKFFLALPEWGHISIMGAVVNGELRELTYPMELDARVNYLSMDDRDGALIYRRSLIFLLEVAFDDTFPGQFLSVDHSVASGGIFCRVVDRLPLTASELKSLLKRMHELVDENLPIERKQVPLEQAVAYFKNKNFLDKVELLKYRQKSHLMMYHLGNHEDYHHGYMVPSSGYIRWFDLKPLGEGFVIQYPRRNVHGGLTAVPESPSLLAAFRQYGDWLEKMGIHNVGSLNAAIQNGRILELILVSEALHEQRISEISARIAEKSEIVKVILIAGPSSSGKTTFSKRLAVQLLAKGIEPFPLEMDNYFVNRELTPRDEKGDYDFESIHALNTAKLSEDLASLIAGKETQLPHFDFKTGQSLPGEIVHLERGQLVILEGIHGLNPNLIPNIPVGQTIRLYASCLTQLNLDRYNRISTTDTRLIRRIVRDARERGYSALQTIQRWESVGRGEKKHIFPYQDYADEMFNSALVYELSALKPLAEPLLRQVPHGSPEHLEAKRLLAFLEWFIPLEHDCIPDNSIVREFVGGSILRDFRLWSNQ